MTERAAVRSTRRSAMLGDMYSASAAHYDRIYALTETHGFAVDGIDLDPTLLAIAAAKCPGGRFLQVDMTDMHLGRTFDAVLCLFGSIAYTGPAAASTSRRSPRDAIPLLLRIARRDEDMDLCWVAVAARPRDKEPVELR